MKLYILQLLAWLDYHLPARIVMGLYHYAPNRAALKTHLRDAGLSSNTAHNLTDHYLAEMGPLSRLFYVTAM